MFKRYQKYIKWIGVVLFFLLLISCDPEGSSNSWVTRGSMLHGYNYYYKLILYGNGDYTIDLHYGQEIENTSRGTYKSSRTGITFTNIKTPGYPTTFYGLYKEIQRDSFLEPIRVLEIRAYGAGEAAYFYKPHEQPDPIIW